MLDYRILGQNISLQMKKAELTEQKLAENLKCSVMDIYKILEGNIILSINEIRKIADIFSVEVDKIITPCVEQDYKQLLNCMGDYEDPTNKNKILDFIDLYVQLETTVNQNNLY